jgi:penicillin-binding protein 1A
MGKTKESESTRRSANRSKGTLAAKERRRPALRFIKFILISIGSALLFIGGAGIGYVSSMLKGLPSISASTFANNSAASVVYDRNGKLIGKITSDGDRQPITSVHQVSENLVGAFVAAEDKTFYSNIGINPLAMGRAVAQDLLGHRIESGASTITQQTVKLAVFPKQERTVHRKVQEIALALELNHVLSKDEIMTDYMNWVYMGRMGTQNVYGVKTASEIMFHKDPEQLNLPESAFLAAIPNNASLFSPYEFPKNTLARQHYILKQMLANNMISQTDYDKAMKYNVVKELQAPPASSLGKYPYLMLLNVEPTLYQNLVQAGIYDNVQQAEAAVPTAGYKIYTTIDLNMQDDVNQVLKNKQLFAGTDLQVQGEKSSDMYEAGVTLMDNKTGGVLAIGGGRDFARDGYDHSDIPRQPGSSIKPLLDYGPAIDLHKITAGTVFDDAPVNFNGYAPKDDEGFSGIVTARTALTQSINVPAVRILNLITPETGMSYLAKMGITTSAKTLLGRSTLTSGDTHQLASAIGGLANGLTVQQMTSAYTTFANQGMWHQSYLIAKVSDQTGSTVFTPKPVVTQVYSPQTAYIINSMLRDVVTSGTATSIGAHFPGYTISGKTGTTDNRNDGWFIGYTPTYTMGLWMGYNHDQPIPSSIYNMKFQVWNDIMTPILSVNPPKKAWPIPQGIVSETICNKSGHLPTALCTAMNDTYSEVFINGTQPTTSCNVMVQAEYVVISGRKYLATTNTPPGEIRTGIFLNPPFQVPDYPTLDSGEYLPTQADPRGGTVLSGGSAPSEPATTLSAPANLAANIANDTAALSWDSVSGADGYIIWRATSANGTFSKIGGPVSKPAFTDGNLPAQANHVYYEVFAVSANAMSEASPVIEVTISPNSPTGPAGSDSGGSNSAGNTSENTSGGNDTGNKPGLESPGSAEATDGSSKSSGQSGASNKTEPETIWIPGEGFRSK